MLSGIAILSGSTAAFAQEAEAEAEAEAKPSVDVIGWFAVRDTAVYTIQESSWRISPADTVMEAGALTKVRIIVTDSTADGYKFDYTFLDFKNSKGNIKGRSEYIANITENMMNKLNGKTVKVLTNDCGMITGIENATEFYSIINSVVNEAVGELLANPEMGEVLKAQGTDVAKMKSALTAVIPPKKIFTGLLEDLQQLFMFHGNSYEIGEFNEHQDATATEPENDIYRLVEVDSETGDYQLALEIVTKIPAGSVKEMLGDFVAQLTNESTAEKAIAGIGKVIDSDATVSQYFFNRNFADGWPVSALKVETTMIGGNGQSVQTNINLDAISTRNPQ